MSTKSNNSMRRSLAIVTRPADRREWSLFGRKDESPKSGPAPDAAEAESP